MTTQPWIYSARVDGAFILAPALLITALTLIFYNTISVFATIPLWGWVILVLGIDVAHVYATIFRTYADPIEFQRRPLLYIGLPVLCWVLGALLYSIDALWFWRVLAYLAVFHFMRQQYGLMMIYGRADGATVREKYLDKLAIYSATLMPLLYWHTHLPRQFDWFVAGDFIALSWTWITPLGWAVYGLILLAYIAKEIKIIRRNQCCNLPKNLLLLGTALSWSAGIVIFNNDLAFTALNVIAHGIPYMALIWIFCRNHSQQIDRSANAHQPEWLKQIFCLQFIPLYLLILLGLAYLEEGLWDGLIWREHSTLFSPFEWLPRLQDHATLTWLIPLLALPQSTHYALDAFIWRLQGKENEWKTTLFFHSPRSSDH
jgi:hypothetical protein